MSRHNERKLLQAAAAAAAATILLEFIARFRFYEEQGMKKSESIWCEVNS